MPNISNKIPFTVRVNSADIGDGAWKSVSNDCYECESAGLRVKVEVESFENTEAVRQVNTITNIGTKNVLLSGFSSAKYTPRGGLSE